MINRNWLRIERSQKGICLIEVLAVVLITGLIGATLATAVFELVNINSSSINHITAIKQVESAVHWLNRDIQMSQTVLTDAESGFPLNLSWVEWDHTVNQVSYALESGNLVRSHSTNGEEPNDFVVAEHISMSAGETDCEFTGGVLTFKITATLSGFRPSSETRTIQVRPRPAQ
jgi:hypothetical protein